MSGDEFTVMLLDCDVEEVEYISMRLLSHLSTAFHLEDRKVFVSASIGAALYPADAEDMEGLIRAADTAMYHAKDDGRNRMRLFKPELRTRLLKESAVENALTEAIRQKNLRLVYQPQFDATDPQRIVSAEALLRWTDPTLGVVSPGEFIPIAERSGLISSLGKLTEQLLVEQLSQWRSRGLQVPPVALNVSARSFQEQEFASRLSALLDTHHLPRDLVRIEITEGSLMSSSEREEGAIERFRETGLALSVDDFGTGYSSLAYLKRLPVTEVKIDKVFVDGLGQDEGDEAIALAIIGMAHALGMITVAEGVEYQHQLDWLCQNGCDLLQGFLLAKPLEAEEFAARLASR
jgi:two-component system CheB/CheR fusion protein